MKNKILENSHEYTGIQIETVFTFDTILTEWSYLSVWRILKTLFQSREDNRKIILNLLEGSFIKIRLHYQYFSIYFFNITALESLTRSFQRPFFFSNFSILVGAFSMRIFSHSKPFPQTIVVLKIFSQNAWSYKRSLKIYTYAI